MDMIMPWTDKVPELYKKAYGADIYETLPELFWDLPESKPSVHRYRYHDFISELFSSSFADNIGSWCRKNGIALTGHMMEEPTLRSQCAALGEAMRSYRGFDIPGIDMLCNNHEFTTAKQAQSAVHQFGYEGMLSELYGVTAWDCDFRTYKHQGDWQAALGVTEYRIFRGTQWAARLSVTILPQFRVIRRGIKNILFLRIILQDLIRRSQEESLL